MSQTIINAARFFRQRSGHPLALGVSLIIAVAVSGCANQQKDYSVQGKGDIPSPVEKHIAESSARIASALERLERTTSVEAPQAPDPVDPAAVPEKLRTPVTQDQTLPVEVAVRGIADRIGYLVRIHGVIPPTPLMVHINATNKPAIQVLEDIGLEIGTRGVVRVDSDNARIDLYITPPKTGVM